MSLWAVRRPHRPVSRVESNAFFGGSPLASPALFVHTQHSTTTYRYRYLVAPGTQNTTKHTNYLSIMSIRDVNPNAEIVSKTQARAVNVAAGVGLLNVLKSNLGPRGTLKLLVGGAGQLKLTKDGLVLLKEMQIQHPTAALIARTATAQDDVTGDGTTSTVLLCGELLRQADRHVSEGLHPRILVEGLEQARDATLKFLATVKVPLDDVNHVIQHDRELLLNIAKTSLNTKVDFEMSQSLADALVSAIQCIYSGPDEAIDLHRIEILSIPRTNSHSNQDENGNDKEGGTHFINGIVMDHGARHPDMPDVLTNCKIMTCNVSLEYEKTETQSGFFYSSAEEREKLVESERQWLDERCKLVIDFKRRVCTNGEVRIASVYVTFVCLLLPHVCKLTNNILYLSMPTMMTVLCHDQSKRCRSIVLGYFCQGGYSMSASCQTSEYGTVDLGLWRISDPFPSRHGRLTTWLCRQGISSHFGR